jgi:hypothetical protein
MAVALAVTVAPSVALAIPLVIPVSVAVPISLVIPIPVTLVVARTRKNADHRSASRRRQAGSILVCVGACLPISIAVAMSTMPVHCHASARGDSFVPEFMKTVMAAPVMRHDHLRGSRARVAGHVASGHIDHVLAPIEIEPVAPGLQNGLESEGDVRVSPE